MRRLVSELAQVGFAVIAAPVGCAVLGATVLAVFVVTALLEAIFDGPGVFGAIMPAGFLGGLVLAFLALVRLYRAMPTRVREAIEIVDEDDGSPRSSLASTPSPPLSHEELAALDAKLASPPHQSEPRA